MTRKHTKHTIAFGRFFYEVKIPLKSEKISSDPVFVSRSLLNLVKIKVSVTFSSGIILYLDIKF